jgi:MFS family permease
MRDDNKAMPPQDRELVDPARRAAGRGLDWLNLFVANVQTGFGPFISVYLTTAGWTQTSIGLALSVGTVAAMASQIPAGALVDRIRRKSHVAVFSILAFTISALCFTIAPIPLFVYLAQVLHAFSSCTLGPAIVALSRRVAGSAALGPRLGRNVRFAAIGNGVGAALMGACGYYASERSVFFLTAILTLPAMLALIPLARFESQEPATPWYKPDSVERKKPLMHVLGDRRLLIFAGLAALFTFANAALLPLASSEITKHAASQATLLVAAAIVVPQAIVALSSPAVGRLAEGRGRRPVLLLGFSVVPLRGLLLALTDEPLVMVAIQALDGLAAAAFGVMVPLIVSDIAGRTAHFNLSLGFMGFAIGVGATLSTTAAGWCADQFGEAGGFLMLAIVGLIAWVLVAIAMPETRPLPQKVEQPK